MGKLWLAGGSQDRSTPCWVRLAVRHLGGVTSTRGSGVVTGNARRKREMKDDGHPMQEAEPNKERFVCFFFRAARVQPSSSPHGPRKEKAGLVTQSSVTLFRIRPLHHDQAPPQRGRRGSDHEEREESSEGHRSCATSHLCQHHS